MDDDDVDPWTWVAPANKKEKHKPSATSALPYRDSPLDVAEVQALLEDAGAIDVERLAVPASAGFCEDMIFASGKSSRHLRSIANVIIAEAKRRPGPKPHNDRTEDEWISLDLDSVVVQLLSPESRERLALEAFWDPTRTDPIPVPDLEAAPGGRA